MKIKFIFGKSKCEIKYCRNVPVKSAKSRQCARCKMKKHRKENPYTYFLNKLRNNAKRRGHECAITIEEFKIFCDETGYLETRGRMSGCMSIDRINQDEGYHFDNIQIMEVGENSRCQHVPYLQKLKDAEERRIKNEIHEKI